MFPEVGSLWTNPLYCQTVRVLEIIKTGEDKWFGYDVVRYVQVDTNKEFFESVKHFKHIRVPKLQWIRSWRFGRSIGQVLIGRLFDKVY